jgi:hypothetical protein
MLKNYDRRNVAAVLTIAALAFALPAEALAGQAATNALKTTVEPAKRRPPDDIITTTCVPGTPDYDIDKCYEDIKD